MNRLKLLDDKVQMILDIVNSFEPRISKIEQLLDTQRLEIVDNPLIYSRVLNETLGTIKTFEKEQKRGILAKELSQLRNLGPSSIYDHLSKLEEAKIIFWQRGSELGLKPVNAKFYSVMTREESLSDLPVIMDLPDDVAAIAQLFLKAGKEGLDKKSLLDKITLLCEEKGNPWQNIPLKSLESQIQSAIYTLLQRVLIKIEKSPDTEIYYAWDIYTLGGGGAAMS